MRVSLDAFLGFLNVWILVASQPVQKVPAGIRFSVYNFSNLLRLFSGKRPCSGPAVNTVAAWSLPHNSE